MPPKKNYLDTSGLFDTMEGASWSNRRRQKSSMAVIETLSIVSDQLERNRLTTRALTGSMREHKTVAKGLRQIRGNYFDRLANKIRAEENTAGGSKVLKKRKGQPQQAHPIQKRRTH